MMHVGWVVRRAGLSFLLVVPVFCCVRCVSCVCCVRDGMCVACCVLHLRCVCCMLR